MHSMVSLIGLCGSLRTASTNARLLQAAVTLMPASDKLTIDAAPGLLPHFNPDLAPDAVPELEAFIARIRSCDGLVISSPVYAGGYPGTLKNALDWLVGTDAFVEKPFMMLSASNRVPAVEKSLVTVLQTMSGVHVDAASVTIPLLGTDLDTDAIVRHPDHAGAIRDSMQRFVDAIC